MTKEKMIFELALQAEFMVINELIEIPSKEVLFDAIVEIVCIFNPEVNQSLNNFAWVEIMRRFGNKKELEKYGFKL